MSLIGAIIAGAVSSTAGGTLKSIGTNAFQNWDSNRYKLGEMATQYGYDSALSAQNAQQELAKQQQQQDFDYMMSSTEQQRKVADMKAAGINPALAGGGLSSTNASASAPTAQTPQPTPQTNARQTAKQAKKEILTTLQTAQANGILKIATKNIEKISEKLAKQPKNTKLRSNLNKYTNEIYNLLV